MFGLSKMWVYGLAALALVAAILGGLRIVYDHGYDARDAEARLEATAAQKRADAAKSALQGTLTALKSAQEQERKNAKQEVDSLRVQLAAGTVRLRVPGAAGGGVRCTCPRAAEARAQPGQAPADAIAPGTGSLEPEVTLPPSISIELLDIAATGDAAIRDLNQCVDSYDALRKTINGLKRTD